jgi:membrane-bound lytic murein transglycosylase D
MRRPLATCFALVTVLALPASGQASPHAAHATPPPRIAQAKPGGKPANPSSGKTGATKTPAAPTAKGTKGGKGTKGAKADPQAAAAAARGELTPQDDALRRRVAGGPSGEDVALGAESIELKALRDAEKELFLPAAPASGLWPADLASPVRHDGAPRVHGSGFAPAPTADDAAPSGTGAARGGRDVSFLAQLQPLDVPTRWDDRLVRYLEFFKDDPRGRATMTVFLRKSGRYRDRMRQIFAAKGVPTDLIWLSMIESGFDPFARSPVGAAGLFQFMPETGKAYGLHQDAWMDQRFAPVPAANAAADFLLDLKQRFGTWDLALASYNMGYGGVLSVVKRYNTNDFWNLAKLEGSLPWETTLYVPKIYAAALVAKNARLFGFDDAAVDAPLAGESATVPAGTSLAEVGRLVGAPTREIETLNPELRAGRTPPNTTYLLQVPTGKAAALTALLAKAAKGAATAGKGSPTAAGDGKPEAKTERKPADVKEAATIADGEKVVVPPETFVYTDRDRVFYKVVAGDRLDAVAKGFAVSAAEVARWNALDPQGRLQEGMMLQLFVPNGTDLSGVPHKKLSAVVPVTAGSDAFFAAFDPKGRKRIVVAAKKDETLEAVAHRYRVTPALAERINRRPRKDVLHAGEPVVLYVEDDAQKGDLPASETATTTAPSLAPRPLPPMAAPPHPELLPPLDRQG